MSTIHKLQPLSFRSIFLSDIHLGFKGSQADLLLNFLHSTQCENLYLAGDIIDLWSMKRGLYWPQSHNNVVRSILGKAKHDTRVIYVPGNHDELIRDHIGLVFGNIVVQQQAIHTTADGKQLLVLHGDEFDSVVQCARFLSILGNHAYDWLISANRAVNGVRRRLGLSYWSLAAYLKNKVKNAVNYISDFEEAIVISAHKHEVDGLICGHIHHASIRTIDNTLYFNCGDWVESCTALVEHHDGKIELIRWADYVERLSSDDVLRDVDMDKPEAA